MKYQWVANTLITICRLHRVMIRVITVLSKETLDTTEEKENICGPRSLCSQETRYTRTIFCHFNKGNNFFDTVVSRYLEVQGTLLNTSRYPYLDISDLQK